MKSLLSLKGILVCIGFLGGLILAGDTFARYLSMQKMAHVLHEEKESFAVLQGSLSTLKAKSDSIDQFLQAVDASENRVRMLYGMKPINKEERLLGVGGLPSVSALAKRELAPYEVTEAEKLKNLADHHLRKIAFSDSILTHVEAKVTLEKKYQNELPSIWPVVGRVTSPYGFRPHPILAMRKFHDGIDIKGTMWTPVVAPADGVVAYSGWRKGYGKMVEITHEGAKLYSRYGHLADMTVEVGDVVKRGDLIAYLGNSGRSTGPHVHYEIRKVDRSGGTRNPRLYLPDTTVIFD